MKKFYSDINNKHRAGNKLKLHRKKTDNKRLQKHKPKTGKLNSNSNYRYKEKSLDATLRELTETIGWQSLLRRKTNTNRSCT